MFIEPIGEMTLFAHRVGDSLLDCCRRSKLVDSKWAWREIGKQKTPRRGDTRGREKQARKLIPEAYRYVEERKLIVGRKVCVREEKYAKKHMPCVFRKKSKWKNTNRKLISVSRGEKCVYERKCKQKNTSRVFLGRKASGKTHPGS